MPVAAVSEYLEAIAHLPAGSALRADGIPWEEYEQLLDDLGPSYAVRIFYDQGKMEIVSPLPAHEKPTNVVHTLVIALRDELNIDIESLGASTLRDEMREKGAEPDDRFYVQNAALVIGKLDLDWQHDPPPDIVVESDLTSSSLDKFAIFAAFGVSEIWRIPDNKVSIWLLTDGEYVESPVSRAFPFLPTDVINEMLAKGLAEGERKAARAFREWVRENH
jgi:Uma2 family endonuclease